MPVIIDRVDLDTTDPPERAPAPEPPRRPRGPTRAELLAMLRREDARRARLKAD